MPSRQLAWWMGILLGLAWPAAVGAAAPAPPWAHWRGPSYQGYSTDTRVPLAWSDSQHLLWKTPLPGNGNSTPILWGDRVFLTAARDKGTERLVLCVRASDGKMLWQRVAAKSGEPG